MDFTDYNKASKTLTDWHHARAMDCLRAMQKLDPTSEEHTELHNDYVFHRSTEVTLHKATLSAIGSFYSA